MDIYRSLHGAQPMGSSLVSKRHFSLETGRQVIPRSATNRSAIFP